MTSIASSLVGPEEPLLVTSKGRRLYWFGRVTRHDTLSETIRQGFPQGDRRRGHIKGEEKWSRDGRDGCWSAMVTVENLASCCSPPVSRIPPLPTSQVEANLIKHIVRWCWQQTAVKQVNSCSQYSKLKMNVTGTRTSYKSLNKFCMEVTVNCCK